MSEEQAVEAPQETTSAPALATEAPQAAAFNSEGWVDSIPEAYRHVVTEKGLKEPADLAQSYYNLTRLHGNNPNVVEMPGEGATDEQMGAFYKTLGRPDTAEDYSINVPDGAATDDSFMNAFKGVAHTAGMSQNAVEQVTNFWHEYNAQAGNQAVQQQQVQADNDMNELKNEWGAAYDQNFNYGVQAVNKFGVSDDVLSGLEQVLGTGQTVKFFSQIGAALGEDNFIAGEGEKSFSAAMTPGEAQAELTRLESDSAFMDKLMAGDPATTEKRMNLQRYAYSGKQMTKQELRFECVKLVMSKATAGWQPSGVIQWAEEFVEYIDKPKPRKPEKLPDK